LTDINKSGCILKNNYFDINIPIKDSDFLSLDESFLAAPRQSDGSLPENNFMRLNPSSGIINAGTDIGFSFKGKAPDLGCFESGY
jgi:hypothetical protein